MNISQLDETASAPLSFWRQDYFGLCSFVPLDYGSRYEHSVVVVPRNWEAMYDLICAPQTFMEAAKDSYGMGTPRDMDNDEVIPWTFEWPISIVIRPLTEATQQTRQTLRMLNGYYDFASILDNWDTLTPTEFRSQVAGAARAPQNPPLPLAPACGSTDGQLEPWSGFDLKFVAEFAIETRVLHIKYVPQDPADLPSQPYYHDPITPATWARVGNTRLHFLHCDVDFGHHRTYQTVAETRAKLAMDYIVDPEVINAWLANINMTPNPEPNEPYVITRPGSSGVDPYGFYVSDGSLTEAGQMKKISQATSASQPPPAFRKPSGGVSVVIDSVWPIVPVENAPLQVSRRNDVLKLTEDPVPPPPYLCINVTTDEDETGDVTIKWYQAPPEPPEGGPE